MTLYRALDKLSNGVPRYGVFDVAILKQHVRELFEQRGIIVPVIAPPLAGVDGWRERAQLLEAAGIITLADVVLFSGVPAGVEAVTWALWQAEAREALTVKCVGCGR